MISPDLAAAAPGAFQPRGAVKAAEGPPPERAFAEFLQGAPMEGAEAEGDEADLLALLDGTATPAPIPVPAPVPTPVPVAIVAVVALPAPVAAPAVAEEGDPDFAHQDLPVAASADLARPVGVGTMTAAAAATVPAAGAPVAAAPVAEAGEIAAGELEGEADGEPEATPRVAGLPAPAGSAPGAGEGRPVVAPAPVGFDPVLQPSTAQSWRLAAVAAEGAQATREPASAPSPREVASQITVAIMQAGPPQLEIRLDPPELGRVQIRLHPTEHGLQAMVFAERPETQDFLRRHAEALRSELSDAGYAQVSLDFAAGGEAPPRDAPAQERRLTAAFEPVAVPAVVREVPQRVAAAGLDIRL